MAFTVLARTSLRQGARTFRTSAVARSDHGHYHHLPFDLPGEKKFAFGTKMFAFLGVGFVLPFVAAGYQLNKSSGAA